MTTLIEAEKARPAAPQAALKKNSVIPRHLALSLHAGSVYPGIGPHDAAAALSTIVHACADCGIAVLTLLRPVMDAHIFDAAMADAASLPAANKVKINLATPRNGRSELLDAVRKIALETRQSGPAALTFDAAKFESYLSTHGLPPVDLFILTGGHAKLSGAMLWQSAYAELLFSGVNWFDFSRGDFDAALADYAQRSRKFGGLA